MRARQVVMCVAFATILLAPIALVIFFAVDNPIGFNDLWGPLAVVFIAEIAATLMCIPGIVRRPRSALAIVSAILGSGGALLSGVASAFCFVAAIAMGFN